MSYRNRAARTPLAALLAGGQLPAAAQDVAVTAYPGLHDDLSLNRHLTTETFIRLYTPGCNATRAKNLAARAWDARQVQHIVDIGERRYRPLAALLKVWDLSDDQYQTLANQPLHDRVVAILRTRDLPQQARRTLQLKAPADRLRWLHRHAATLDSGSVHAHLTHPSMAKAHKLDELLLWGTLAAHPGIWPRLVAKHTAGAVLAVLAAAAQPEATQLRLVEIAEQLPCGRNDTRAGIAVALADRTDTAPEVRARAWDVLAATGRLHAAHSNGVLPEQAGMYDNAPAAQQPPAALDALLARPTHSLARWIQLCEIVDGADLRTDQAVRAAHRLAGGCHGRDVPGAAVHYRRLIERYPDTAQILEWPLQRAERGTAGESSPQPSERRAPNPAAVTISRRGGSSPAFKPAVCAEALEQLRRSQATVRPQTHWGAPWAGDPNRASLAMYAAFGDNRDAWMAAFAIADHFAGTIVELIDAAVAVVSVGCAS